VFEAFMLECRQLVGRRDSIAFFTFHSTFISPRARPRGGGVVTAARWTLRVQPPCMPRAHNGASAPHPDRWVHREAG
jgi:hypothetical protein